MALKEFIKDLNMIENHALNPKFGLLKMLGLSFIFLWFFVGGIAHFAFTDLEMKIVPPWLPDHRLLVLVSGALELMGAIGVLYVPTRRAAGWGLILLAVAVTPANNYIWQHANQFPGVPYWALTLRLPIQLGLVACIWWSTHAPRKGKKRGLERERENI